MTDHADAGTLAAYAEGMLSARKHARIAAHLSGCPQCAGIATQLAQVTAVLAASGPRSLPPGVAARIDAALAHEISLASARGGVAPAAPMDGREATPPGVGATRPADGAVVRRPRRIRRTRLTLRLAAGAVAAVIAGVGGYLLARPPAPAGPASVAAPAHAPSAALPGSAQAGTLHGLASYPVISSRTDYQPDRISAQVEAVLARLGTQFMPPNGAMGRFGVGHQQLAGCVTRVTGGTVPRLVVFARFAGRPAILVVVQSATRGQGWVVGTRCAAGGADLIQRFTVPGTG